MNRQIEEPQDKNIGSPLYASGRIAMLEEKLIPGNVMETLPYSESERAIMHKISSHYQGESLNEALEAAEIADMELYKEIASEAVYIKMFLIPKEAHNLRRVLKEMFAGPGGEIAEDDSAFLLPYISSPEQVFKAVKKASARVSPDKGFVEGRFAASLLDKPLPEWQEKAIEAALRRFKQTGEASDLSAEVDKAAMAEAARLAKESANPWLIDWISLQASLTDISLVLRCRHLKVSPEVAKERASMVSPFNPDLLMKAVAANEAEFAVIIRKMLNDLPFVKEKESAKLYDMAIRYAEEGPSAFSALTDGIKISVLKEASSVFGKQEQVFAYFYFREYERKNLRLALAGVANGLDPEKVKAMLRPSFRKEALR